MLHFLKFSEENDQNTIKKISFYLLFIFIVFFYVKDMPVVNNFAMLGIFISSFFFKSKQSKFKTLTKPSINLGFILFFCWHFVSLINTENLSSGWEEIVSRITFLAISLPLIFISLKRENWLKLLTIFVFSTTISSLAGFFYGLKLAIDSQDFGFIYNDNISELLIGKQAVYYALYVSSAILSAIFLLFQKDEVLKKLKIILFIVIIWMLFILFLLASKTAMLALFSLAFMWIVFELIKRKRILETLVFILAIGFSGFILTKAFPKTLNRFNGLFYAEYQFENREKENHFNAAFDSTKWNSTNTRLAIWHCSLEVWKENKILGTGIGDKLDELYENYQKNNFIYAFETEKNTHNQYLDVLLSMGILGLVVFVFGLIFFPIWIYWRQNNLLSIVILLLFAVGMITENVFDRYQGLVFIPFILALAEKLSPIKEIIDYPDYKV